MSDAMTAQRAPPPFLRKDDFYGRAQWSDCAPDDVGIDLDATVIEKTREASQRKSA
jgi:hypothetical protein